MNRKDIILKRALAAPCHIDEDAMDVIDVKATDQTSQSYPNNTSVQIAYISNISSVENVIDVKATDQTSQSYPNNTSVPIAYLTNISSVESNVSIDPPSYSPITPHNNSNVRHVLDDAIIECSTMSPELKFVSEPEEILQHDSRSEDSPIRPMSPATLGLLNTFLDDDNDDDSVKDPDYTIVPESSDISDTESESILQGITEQHNNLSRNDQGGRCLNEENSYSDNNEIGNEGSKGRPKRGRKRKYDEYTLAERKGRKYANLPYNGKNKYISAKYFKNYQCSCKGLCHIKVSEEIRRKEFNKFITLGSYEAQLLFICANVTENIKKRSYVSVNTTRDKKPRQFSRVYKIVNNIVCRDMFLKTFQITTQKVTISLKKQRDGNNLRDCRGSLSGGWNKTPQDDIDFAWNVINNLPKYISHYRRSQNGDALYLQTGLTMQKIYDLYVNEFKEVNGDTKKCLSITIFRNIFLTKFNLRFKSLKKDTCNKCDQFAAKEKSLDCLPIEEKNRLLAERHKHLHLAQSLRSQMNSHIARAQVDQTFECITFDMEKTLPLPRIPTNVVFYKRQLWFYNCGIHVSSSNQGYCFVWVEGEAGRGAQEVGSCLSKFINHIMRPNIEYLSLWSDSAGGQNRNIKMVLLLKMILATHPTLKVIELNFLESGHTFLPNDTDFGKIETHLKNFQRLYTADDYINVIKTCTKKTPLIPIRMTKEDFIGTEKLEKNITNRKLFTNKEKVSWLKAKHIQLKKDFLYSIFINTEDEDNVYQDLYIGRKYKGNVLPLSPELLSCLWPNGKTITQAKLDDLKSMFHLIPDDCLSFYKQLKGMEGTIDDIEGFGGEPDFELEKEEDSI